MAPFPVEFSLLFLLSILLSALLFPLVYLSSLFYSWLARRYPKIPRVFFLFALTLIATFIALALAELYSGFLLSQLSPPPSP